MQKLPCVLCRNAVLSVEVMKPRKLKRHLYSKRPLHAGKDRSFFQYNDIGLKEQKFDSHDYF